MPNAPPSIVFVPHATAPCPVPWRGSAVAVIDVLRATTSITSILAHGGAGVIPCRSIPQAMRWARRLESLGPAPLLAGERSGLRVPGFDRGNSPAEFVRGIRGRTVVLATSNGTRALVRAVRARRVLAVCLNNLSAAARKLLRGGTRRIVVLAAGETGRASAEDTLAAGLLIQALILCLGARGPGSLDKSAKRAYALARGVVAPRDLLQPSLRVRKLAAALTSSPHGRGLRRLGFAADIRQGAILNTTPVVGVLRRFPGRGFGPKYWLAAG